MDIIHPTNKGKMLNSLEKFYIHKEVSINNQITEKCKIKPNVIFDTLIQTDINRAHRAST